MTPFEKEEQRFWVPFTLEELQLFLYAVRENTSLKKPFDIGETKLNCHLTLLEIERREPRPRPEILNLEELEIEL